MAETLTERGHIGSDGFGPWPCCRLGQICRCGSVHTHVRTVTPLPDGTEGLGEWREVQS